MKWFAVAAVALVIGSGLGWAGAVIFSPPEDVLSATPFTFVEVEKGQVGASINLNATAEWTPVPVGTNLAAGTVTTLNVEPGQEVGQGTVLYTVNLRPVAIASGTIPAFRDLARGTTGPDVAQLQFMLAAIGLYAGAIDGQFGSRTAAAVRTWQKALGVAQDGAVRASDVIFVPTLPTRVALDQTVVSRGTQLGGGEKVVSGLPAQPDFVVVVTDSQSALIPDGARVSISAPDGATWESVAIDRRTNADSAVEVVLAGRDGATVCGDECGQLSLVEPTLLAAVIVTVDPVDGLVLPSAALKSTLGGDVVVIDDMGIEHSVTVVTSARGMSVVEGVTEGQRVRIPVDEG